MWGHLDPPEALLQQAWDPIEASGSDLGASLRGQRARAAKMCIFLWFWHTFQRPGLRAGIQNAKKKTNPLKTATRTYVDIYTYECISTVFRQPSGGTP